MSDRVFLAQFVVVLVANKTTQTGKQPDCVANFKSLYRSSVRDFLQRLQKAQRLAAVVRVLVHLPVTTDDFPVGLVPADRLRRVERKHGVVNGVDASIPQHMCIFDKNALMSSQFFKLATEFWDKNLDA